MYETQIPTFNSKFKSEQTLLDCPITNDKQNVDAYRRRMRKLRDISQTCGYSLPFVKRFLSSKEFEKYMEYNQKFYAENRRKLKADSTAAANGLEDGSSTAVLRNMINRRMEEQSKQQQETLLKKLANFYKHEYGTRSQLLLDQAAVTQPAKYVAVKPQVVPATLPNEEKLKFKRISKQANAKIKTPPRSQVAKSFPFDTTSFRTTKPHDIRKPQNHKNASVETLVLYKNPTAAFNNSQINLNSEEAIVTKKFQQPIRSGAISTPSKSGIYFRTMRKPQAAFRAKKALPWPLPSDQMPALTPEQHSIALQQQLPPKLSGNNAAFRALTGVSFAEPPLLKSTNLQNKQLPIPKQKVKKQSKKTLKSAATKPQMDFIEEWPETTALTTNQQTNYVAKALRDPLVGVLQQKNAESKLYSPQGIRTGAKSTELENAHTKFCKPVQNVPVHTLIQINAAAATRQAKLKSQYDAALKRARRLRQYIPDLSKVSLESVEKANRSKRKQQGYKAFETTSKNMARACGQDAQVMTINAYRAEKFLANDSEKTIKLKSERQTKPNVAKNTGQSDVIGQKLLKELTILQLANDNKKTIQNARQITVNKETIQTNSGNQITEKQYLDEVSKPTAKETKETKDFPVSTYGARNQSNSLKEDDGKQAINHDKQHPNIIAEDTQNNALPCLENGLKQKAWKCTKTKEQHSTAYDAIKRYLNIWSEKQGNATQSYQEKPAQAVAKTLKNIDDISWLQTRGIRNEDRQELEIKTSGVETNAKEEPNSKHAREIAMKYETAGDNSQQDGDRENRRSSGSKLANDFSAIDDHKRQSFLQSRRASILAPAAIPSRLSIAQPNRTTDTSSINLFTYKPKRHSLTPAAYKVRKSAGKSATENSRMTLVKQPVIAETKKESNEIMPVEHSKQIDKEREMVKETLCNETVNKSGINNKGYRKMPNTNEIIRAIEKKRQQMSQKPKLRTQQEQEKQYLPLLIQNKFKTLAKESESTAKLKADRCSIKVIQGNCIHNIRGCCF